MNTIPNPEITEETQPTQDSTFKQIKITNIYLLQEDNNEYSKKNGFYVTYYYYKDRKLLCDTSLRLETLQF
jgi:hypothetical protein